MGEISGERSAETPSSPSISSRCECWIAKAPLLLGVNAGFSQDTGFSGEDGYLRTAGFRKNLGTAGFWKKTDICIRNLVGKRITGYLFRETAMSSHHPTPLPVLYLQSFM